MAPAQVIKPAPLPVPPPRVPARAVQVRLAQPLGVQNISDQQIDNWIFREDHSAEAARRRQESLLTLKVEDVDRVCRLSAQQKQKLLLTGQGDIKRFFDRYEILKEKCRTLMGANPDLNAVLQETSPMAMTLTLGLFGTGSLFHKSIGNVLSKPQVGTYDAVSQERIRFRHNANIDLLVTTLEEGVPLSSAQRQKFAEFLRKEIKPARITGSYDFYYLMWQLGEVPEEKLKANFDNAQWRGVERFVTQYRGIEPTLRQAGYFKNHEVDEEGADADAVTPK
jgi:hypothetical protein